MKAVIAGIFMILAGIAVIYYHQQLYRTFGDVSWARRAFGDGRMVYPLLGVLLIVCGVLLIFGGSMGDFSEVGVGFGALN